MATHLQDRYAGCLLGQALGDACGAPLEGGWPERLLWRCIGTTRQGEMRWTDDTQMALDIGEVLLVQGHDDGALPVDDIAQRFARSYRWSRGYGPGAAKVLRRIRRGMPWQQASRSVYPAGSWGNGGAMRSPVVALWWPGNAEQLVQSTTAITQITHGHALAIEGAVLIAVATAAAIRGEGAPSILLAAMHYAYSAGGGHYDERLRVASAWLQGAATPSAAEVRQKLGNGMAALESCVTALYVALRFAGHDWQAMQAFVARVGGDVDSIGAMAGAIWGAAHGAARLPADALQRLEQRARIEAVANGLYARRHTAQGGESAMAVAR